MGHDTEQSLLKGRIKVAKEYLKISSSCLVIKNM